MQVVSVVEGQQPDAAGQFVDVYEITVVVDDRSPAFTVTVPKSGDPVAAARAAIDALAAQVSSLYAL